MKPTPASTRTAEQSRLKRAAIKANIDGKKGAEAARQKKILAKRKEDAANSKNQPAAPLGAFAKSNVTTTRTQEATKARQAELKRKKEGEAGAEAAREKKRLQKRIAESSKPPNLKDAGPNPVTPSYIKPTKASQRTAEQAKKRQGEIKAKSKDAAVENAAKEKAQLMARKQAEKDGTSIRAPTPQYARPSRASMSSKKAAKEYQEAIAKKKAYTSGGEGKRESAKLKKSQR